MHDSSSDDVIAIGLDIPGPVADDGTVGFLPNIRLDPEGLIHAISTAHPRASVAFVNDANAAALGEMWVGVARGASSFVLIALGTGVGAGVVVNGRLVAGAFGAGGEIGHITVNPDETLTCGCGRKGCLEQYASATGVVRLYLKECEDRGVTPVEIEHGGAVPVTQYVIPRVPQRLRRNAKAKQSIARYAASLVSDGEMILVGSGSTTLAFVRALSEKKGITIISNDCNVIEYAEQHLPNATIVSTGGSLGRDYRHYYGSMVASSLSDIYLDKVFLGADGFEPDFGFLAEFEQTALTKVEFLKHASAPSDNDAPRLLVRAVERICSHPGKPYVDVAVRDMGKGRGRERHSHARSRREGGTTPDGDLQLDCASPVQEPSQPRCALSHHRS